MAPVYFQISILRPTGGHTHMIPGSKTDPGTEH